MPRPADQLRQSTTVKCEIKWQQSSSTRTKLESKFRRIAQQVDLRQCLSEGYNNLNRKKTTPSYSKLRIYQRESTRLYSPTIWSGISVKASTTSQDLNITLLVVDRHRLNSLLPQELWHGFSASWESSIWKRNLHYPGNRTQDLLQSGEMRQPL